jgi:hypothetical protein
MSVQTTNPIPYRALSAAALGAVIAALGIAGPAHASKFQVTNTKDHGKGSLKKAITLSDKNKGRDVIQFKKSLNGEIAIRKSQPVTDPVRIIGNGDDDLALLGTLSGSQLEFTTNKRTRSRLANLSLKRVSIDADGQGGDRGGLQVIDAKLDGDNSTSRPGINSDRAPLIVSGSSVSGFLGSGIAVSQAPSEITETTVSGNGGNGVSASSGDMVIERSTLSGNRSWGAYASYDGFVGLINSTVSGNGDPTNVDSGGLIADHGSFKIESSTITDNFFAESGGIGGQVGAAMSGTGAGSITIANSIVAGNHGRNCSPKASFLSEGGTVFDEANGCDGLAAGDQLADPLLGPLANNGGPTKTHSIDAASPAVGGARGDSPDVDQRGVVRDEAPDSGSFEVSGL